jgi:hypothetical protein
MRLNNDVCNTQGRLRGVRFFSRPMPLARRDGSHTSLLEILYAMLPDIFASGVTCTLAVVTDSNGTQRISVQLVVEIDQPTTDFSQDVHSAVADFSEGGNPVPTRSATAALQEIGQGTLGFTDDTGSDGETRTGRDDPAVRDNADIDTPPHIPLHVDGCVVGDSRSGPDVQGAPSLGEGATEQGKGVSNEEMATTAAAPVDGTDAADLGAAAGPECDTSSREGIDTAAPAQQLVDESDPSLAPVDTVEERDCENGSSSAQCPPWIAALASAGGGGEGALPGSSQGGGRLSEDAALPAQLVTARLRSGVAVYVAGLRCLPSEDALLWERTAVLYEALRAPDMFLYISVHTPSVGYDTL